MAESRHGKDESLSPHRLARRDLLKLAAGLAGAALMGACAPGAAPEGAAKEAAATPTEERRRRERPPSIRYLMWGQVDPKEDAFIQRYVETAHEFEVEYVVSDPDEVPGMVAAGNPPDVWWSSNLGRLGKEGHLLDLQPYIDQDASIQNYVKDYIPALLEAYRGLQGDLYGLPREASTWCIVYNKELLNKAGAPSPRNGWTWHDMLAAAEAINKLGNDVHGLMAGFWKGWWDCDYTTLIFQNGGKCMNAEGLLGFDAPEAMGAFDWIHDTYHVRKVGITGAYARSLGDWNLQIVAGKLGMVYDLVSGLRRFDTDRSSNPFLQMAQEGKLGAAPLPVGIKEGNSLTNGGLVAWAKSRAPQAAYHLIRLMCGAEGITELLDPTMNIPANTGIPWPKLILAKPGLQSIAQEINWIWQNVRAGQLPFNRNDLRWDDTTVQELMVDGLDRVLNQGQPPKEAIPELVAKVNGRMKELGQ